MCSFEFHYLLGGPVADVDVSKNLSEIMIFSPKLVFLVTSKGKQTHNNLINREKLHALKTINKEINARTVLERLWGRQLSPGTWRVKAEPPSQLFVSAHS